MLLCDEYSTRHNLPINQVKFVKKGFAFFGQKNDLLVIKWRQEGPHPGFYEISECALEKRIRTIKVDNVSWEDYEYFIRSWKQKNKIITDKNSIFLLAWEYFIRKNDKFFSENCDIEEVFKTLDETNENRIVDCVYFLEKLSTRHSNIANFWHDKLSDIVFSYCYWLNHL